MLAIDEAYRKLGRYEESKEAFVELQRRYPDSAYVNKLVGMAFDYENRFGEALREFEAALAKAPQLPGVRLAIGAMHLKERRTREAREWLEKELEIDRCSAPSHYYLGEIERAEGSSGKAEGRYRQAIRCDPGHPDAHLGLGAILEGQGRLEEAARLYRRAAKLRPEQAEGHYRLGRVLRRLGHEEEARKALERTREIHEANQRKAEHALDAVKE